MPLSPADWHARYTQQAGWTRQLRQYLLEKAGVSGTRRLLEVGCGSGAVLAELAGACQGETHGLDIDYSYLELARQHAPRAYLTCADAHCLPYHTASFDLTGCHFLLLWVDKPERVVAEMKRVTHPGGAVLLMAEPDYGGRIDYPQELEILGEWQAEALRRQGANPQVGRRLAGLLSRAGCVEIESGVLGGEWSTPRSVQDWQQEWQVLRADLEQLPEVWPARRELVDSLQEIDRRAWERGERTLFVPTFYAWGRA